MTPEHEQHLNGILNATEDGIAEKYRRGQDEHGGRMWRKGGMLAQAEAEAYDNLVYLATLRQQVAQALEAIRMNDGVRARRILEAILGPAAEAESDAFPE